MLRTDRTKPIVLHPIAADERAASDRHFATLDDDAPASALMASLADTMAADRVSVGELVDVLQGRALGLLLLILALPMCVPNIPGISTIFGVLLIAPAVQLMRGRSSIWAPRQVRAWTVDARGLRSGLRAGAGILRRIERLTRPRLRALSRWPVSGLIGLQTLVMALVLILPMWGANFIPAVAVTLTGVGLLQRDGVATLLSIPVAAGAIAWVYLGAKYTIVLTSWFADWAAGLFGFAV